MKINKKSLISFIEDKNNLPTELHFLRIIQNAYFENNIFYAYSIKERAFYKYSDELKFWKSVQVEEVENEVWSAYSSVLQKIDVLQKTLYEKSKAKTNFIFSMNFEKIRRFVKSFGALLDKMPDVQVAKYIPLKNGYIDLKTLKFKNLDRKIYNRYVLPYNYKEDTQEPKLFLKFIDQIQPNKAHREFLLNWLAYMLIPGNPRQKALFMLGSGQNGKGVLTRIMQNIIGKENTTALTIPQIDTEKYHMSKIVNSLVNFSPDNDPNDKLHVGTFKTTTGGDTQMVRDIHGSPFDMVFLGKLVFSVNKMPYFSSKDSAVLRRVEILQFPVIVSDENKIENLEDRILESGGDELFMFLLKRARELSKIKFKYDVPKDIVEFSRAAVEENDSVFDFLEDFLLRNPEKQFQIPYTKIFQEYKEHCIESNFKPNNKTTFKENLLMHSIKREDIDISFVRKTAGNVFIFERKHYEVPIVYETINENGMIVDKNGNELF